MKRATGWDDQVASAIVGELKGRDGPLLPILHALQEEFGYVDQRVVAELATALNLSRAEVTGTISFYHDFRANPAGRHVIKICRAEACQSVGCEDLVAHLKRRHGLDVDALSADGLLTIETVYCLGNCALGPAILADGEPVGRVDADTLDSLVARAGSERALTDGEVLS